MRQLETPGEALKAERRRHLHLAVQRQVQRVRSEPFPVLSLKRNPKYGCGFDARIVCRLVVSDKKDE